MDIPAYQIGLLAIAAVIAGVVFLARAIRRKLASAASDMNGLLTQGEPAVATITEVEKRRTARRGQHWEFYLAYTFRTRGQNEVQKKFRISPSDFNKHSVGDEIAILYLPSDPSISATQAMVDKVRDATLDRNAVGSA